MSTAQQRQKEREEQIDRLDTILDDALSRVWIDDANPVDVRDALKAALKPFLKRGWLVGTP